MSTCKTAIIIIEDDPIISLHISQVLASMDYDEILIFDEWKALDSLLYKISCSIIISNLKLLDGWIRDYTIEQFVTASDRILILSGLNNSYSEQILTQINPGGVLFKPFSAGQLKKVLREMSLEMTGWIFFSCLMMY